MQFAVLQALAFSPLMRPMAAPTTRSPAPVAQLAVSAVTASLAQRLDGQLGASSVSCEIFGHTKVSLRRFDSTRWSMERRVPCLSLTNIEVASSHRRQGHARRTLRALTTVAKDSRRVFIARAACQLAADRLHACL